MALLLYRDFHVDIVEVQTVEGNLYLFVVIDPLPVIGTLAITFLAMSALSMALDIASLRFLHPCANGQVERMNWIIKEVTAKRFHYDDYEQLLKPIADFIDAYNFGRRLKTLKALTPYAFICRQ